ncbi:MAG: heme exporter protein CcmD [Gammaproteobacteria bacterium]|nr:heme exporter protein CcmD [Gammaproteobacteria bacterium]
MIEFLNMGGYGAYVWSAYGIGFVVLLANVRSARAYYRKQLARAIARRQDSNT